MAVQNCEPVILHCSWCPEVSSAVCSGFLQVPNILLWVCLVLLSMYPWRVML